MNKGSANRKTVPWLPFSFLLRKERSALWGICRLCCFGFALFIAVHCGTLWTRSMFLRYWEETRGPRENPHGQDSTLELWHSNANQSVIVIVVFIVIVIFRIYKLPHQPLGFVSLEFKKYRKNALFLKKKTWKAETPEDFSVSENLSTVTRYWQWRPYQ